MGSVDGTGAGGRGGEGQVEDVPDEPDDVEDAQHPERCHQFVGRRAPGNPSNQAASVRSFNRATPRGLTISLLHAGERICNGFVHRGRGS